ncbi:MAG: beta-hydroxyacyl-ACP dehydratase [Candidatus Aphodosoma sp.]
MLQNTYFTVLERVDNADNTVFTVRLEKGHPVYAGHFPGDPVSPGVCNLQMVKECAEIVAGRSLTFSNISQYRLMEVVSPFKQDLLQITVAVTPKDGEFLLTASAQTSGAVCISVKGTLVGKQEGL